MKSFLEEYGFAILAAIVVILLIAFCTPVGSLIKNQVMQLVGNFSDTTEMKMSATQGAEATIVLEQEDENGTFKVTIVTESTTNIFDVYLKTIKPESDWAYAGKATSTNKQKELEFASPVKLADKWEVQAKIINLGKKGKTYYLSNIIKYKGNKVDAIASTEEPGLPPAPVAMSDWSDTPTGQEDEISRTLYSYRTSNGSYELSLENCSKTQPDAGNYVLVENVKTYREATSWSGNNSQSGYYTYPPFTKPKSSYCDHYDQGKCKHYITYYQEPEWGSEKICEDQTTCTDDANSDDNYVKQCMEINLYCELTEWNEWSEYNEEPITPNATTQVRTKTQYSHPIG